MAGEFLSQEEVNLLLETLGKEEKKEVFKEEERVKPLDLNLFERISAGRMPGLELIFEKWASSLRKGLTSLVATMPDVYKENVSIV
ncbi:MAG: flagellar motor switch protein FliM, partial [Aquificaceae bacterium]